MMSPPPQSDSGSNLRKIQKRFHKNKNIKHTYISLYEMRKVIYIYIGVIYMCVCMSSCTKKGKKDVAVCVCVCALGFHKIYKLLKISPSDPQGFCF